MTLNPETKTALAFEAPLEYDVLRALFELEVVVVRPENPFVLASGKTSPVYFDHRRLFSEPRVCKKAIESWALHLEKKIPNLGNQDLVFAGTATAGIVPAFALAQCFEKRFCYVRSGAKKHGLGRMVEGVFRPGDRCVLVDDMVTTGKSVLEAAEVLKKEGGQIVAVTSFTTHGLTNTLQNFEASHLPLFPRVTSRSILDQACSAGILSENNRAAVLAWLENQEGTL
jgi:orotate phosphoribosyltransferase